MGRRLLIPREHGTWGELLFPLCTALSVGALDAPAVGLSAAAFGGYLSCEGLQTLAGWRGPRAGRESHRAALRSVLIFGGLAALTGVWAYLRAPVPVRVALWIAAGLTAVTGATAVRGGLRTAAGEVLVALTLGVWSVPVALAGGVAPRQAIGCWLLWGGVFGGGTLAVRALIARQTRREAQGLATSAVGLVGLTVGVLWSLARDGHVPWIVLAGFLPAAGLVGTVALAPIPARRLRSVGWSLVGASVLLFAALVGARV